MQGWRTSRPVLVALGILFALAAARAADHALDQIRQRGALRWGADAEGGAPFVYPDPRKPEQLIGFEYDLADALARELGVRAEMVQNSWSGLVPGLKRGDFDIILNGLEITEEHRQQVALSRPYYAYAQQIVTRSDTQGLDTPEKLRGKRVGVLAASAGMRLLDQTGGIDVRVYPGNLECFKELELRRLDAAVMDLPVTVHYLPQVAGMKRSGPPFAVGYYGIGVRSEDKGLIEAVNQAIARLLADGSIERICSRYGLWDANQASLATYREAGPVAEKTAFSLRQWRKYMPLLLRGAWLTVEISCLSMILAVAGGLLLALTRLYGPPPLNWLAAAYIEVVRGTPLLIQLLIIYYGLPSVGVHFNPFTAALVGLGCNYAAYEAENYRAGIQAIPRGQMDAALALGMTRLQAIRRIIVPQAMRLVIPPVTNDFIALLKDSSIVSVIAMEELTLAYHKLANTYFDYIGLGLVAAALYFALSYPASLLANYVERRLRC